MCSILWWILYIWEAICWNFSHFALIHALSTRGEKFVHDLGTWEHLEGVPIGLGNFWAVWCRVGHMGQSNRSQAVRCLVGGLTAYWRWSNRLGQSEQNFARCCIFVLHCCIGSEGVCFGSGGACICAGGAFCVVRSFGLVVCALCLSMVLSRMCWAIALA
jgi:hypothetical protein